MRHAQRAFRACALAAMLTSSLRAAADDVCLSPATEQTLASCDGVGIQAPVAKEVGRPPPAPPPPPKPKASPKPPNEEATKAAVDVRRAAATPRATALLITEIQGLESLLASTSKGSPDLPGLVRRVADDYMELENAAMHASNASSAKTAKSARQAAIKNLKRLQTDFPKWCRINQPQPTGCVDDALYDMAYELELDGQPDKARTAYLDLIKSSPTSKHVPKAYLAFGELYFQEAQGDPSKWGLAEAAYKEVLKYPASQGPEHGFAQYKLAYVYWNKGDFAQALTAMKHTIEVAAQAATGSSATTLAASARRDLVPVYALSGDAKKAASFFEPLAGGRDKLLAMLASLGQAYADTGHYDDAIEVYRDLVKRDPGHACDYEGHVAEATLALKSGDKPAIVKELDALAELEVKTSKGNADKDLKQACSNQTAELLAETAMAWHLEAVGTGGVRGTNDPKTFEAAGALYTRVVSRFTGAELAGFTFTKIVKEDWPTRQRLAFWLADLAYSKKDWDKCASAFDAVVQEDPKSAVAGEAAYTSALCYQNAFHAAHANGSERARLGSTGVSGATRDLTATESAMQASFTRYLCVAKSKKGDKEPEDRVVDVEFARARTYFEARHWELAAAAFRRIALDHPTSDAATAAADLELEALNVLLQRGRPACLATMKTDDQKVKGLYCEGDKRKANDEFCARMDRVGRDVERAIIEDLVRTGDEKKDTKKLEEAGERYLAIWNQTGAAACEASKPDCAKMEEILANAARAFQGAQLLAKAISVRKLLTDPKYHLDKTDIGKKALREIGLNYQAIAVYDDAARYLERYGRENPTMDKAPEALEDAILLWLGLGDEDRAFAAAQAFERELGSKKPALSAQIAFALGEHFAVKGQWAEAKKRLLGGMSLIDRSGTVDVTVAAHALLGRTLTALGGNGSSELAKVRASFRDPAALVKRIEVQSGGDKDEATRRLRRALSAWGEAIYAGGEEKRRVAEAIKFPDYKGSGKREDVLKFVNTQLLAWIQKKQRAIEAAEKDYASVMDVQPAAPPEWVIASGSRVGQLWSRFVAEFRAAPIPAEWKQNGMSPNGVTWEEIRATYYEAIDKASEPYKQRAKVAMKTCLKYAVTFQHFDEHARGCERWLAKTYPTEFHAVDEISAPPSRTGGGVIAKPAGLEARVSSQGP